MYTTMFAPATAARTLGYVALGEYALATTMPGYADVTSAAIWSARDRFPGVCEPNGPTISAILSGASAAFAGRGAAIGASSATAIAAAAKMRYAGTAYRLLLLPGRTLSTDEPPADSSLRDSA